MLPGLPCHCALAGGPRWVNGELASPSWGGSQTTLTELAGKLPVLLVKLAVVSEKGDDASHLERLAQPNPVHEEHRSTLKGVVDHLDHPYQLVPSGNKRLGVDGISEPRLLPFRPRITIPVRVLCLVEERQTLLGDSQHAPEVIGGRCFERFDSFRPSHARRRVQIEVEARGFVHLEVRVRQCELALNEGLKLGDLLF
jgi:hypothetical protein